MELLDSSYELKSLQAENKSLRKILTIELIAIDITLLAVAIYKVVML